MNPIELNLFSSRITAVCDEMGTVLRRTAFSPNIKDRLDFSCAVFDPEGELCAQAAHIPIHLGSMAFAMVSIVTEVDWCAGDMLVLNDPFLGGTHLPDVTLVAPVFDQERETLLGFVANRAHHADIGCDSPGSMPISKTLEDEGRIIPPTFLYRQGELQKPALQLMTGEENSALDTDYAAQFSANQIGVLRLIEFVNDLGVEAYLQSLTELNNYGERLASSIIKGLEPGSYSFEDVMDDDGVGSVDIPIAVTLTIDNDSVVLDFNNSAKQVDGNLNCPISVAAAAAYYCFRCLMPEFTPACAGTFRMIEIVADQGTIVNAKRPAAVAAGNVETSTRLVDVILGALAQAVPEKIPAASQGSMNNVAMGYIDNRRGKRWDYYETLAGGTGGGPRYAGLNAVHSHMTNTLNTPIESVEMHYPLRIRRYAILPGTGGSGHHRGGNGLIREYEFLEDAHLSLLTERRRHPAWGLAGGSSGAKGINKLNGEEIPGKCSLRVKAGDRLQIQTPGGGGFGADSNKPEV